MRGMIYGYLPHHSPFLGFLNVYIAFELHKRYPKQTVIQLSEQILGKFAGEISQFMHTIILFNKYWSYH